jgi:hypothetical protein
MRNVKAITGLLLITMMSAAQAQQATPPATGYMTGQQLGLYVFPAKEQTPAQQSTDEQACYTWAVEQSKYNPITDGSPDKDSAAVAAANATAAATQGAAVGGAAKGAVVGVAVGAIAGDAGEGAAIGAVAGGVAGRRAKKQAEANAAKQGAAQATADSAAVMNNFKKAMTACLTGKGYTVN